MADKSLLTAEAAAHDKLKEEWKKAQAYDKVVGQKRNFTEWAEGRPSASRFYPVGPVWEVRTAPPHAPLAQRSVLVCWISAPSFPSPLPAHAGAQHPDQSGHDDERV